MGCLGMLPHEKPGAITEYMCDVCDNYVFENLGCDPNNKMDIRTFICVTCGDSLTSIYVSSQRARDEEARFLKDLEKYRTTIRKQDKENPVTIEDIKGEQLTLW